MANYGKFKDRNPNFQSAGIGYPTLPPGVPETISMPTKSDFTTYEADFLKKNLEKTELCELGLKKHITRVKALTSGPYTYLGEMHEGQLKYKNLLGRKPQRETPANWDITKPFGMKIIRGYTTAQTMDGQGKMTSELKCQAPLGKPKRRYNIENIDTYTTTFGIPTLCDHRGKLMWELFSTSYGEDEYEELDFLQ